MNENPDTTLRFQYFRFAVLDSKINEQRLGWNTTQHFDGLHASLNTWIGFALQNKTDLFNRRRNNSFVAEVHTTNICKIQKRYERRRLFFMDGTRCLGPSTYSQVPRLTQAHVWAHTRATKVVRFTCDPAITGASEIIAKLFSFVLIFYWTVFSLCSVVLRHTSK